MSRLAGTVALSLAMFVSAPVQAQDLGDEASGSMSITVVIAPFGAAIAAAEGGAVGAWSVAGANDGVMISAPDTLAPSSPQSLSIFNNANAPISLTAANGDLAVVRGGREDFRGLSRQNFSLKLGNHASADPVSVVISSI